MLRIILSIAIWICILNFSCKSIPKLNVTCESFKNGKFILKSKFDSTTYFITRVDSIQKEENLKTGYITFAEVRWVSSCEYELRYKSDKGLLADSLFKYIQDGVLATKILSFTSEYYIFESRMKGIETRYSDTIWLRQN